MGEYIFMLCVVIFLAFFAQKRFKAFNSFVITPSYKVWLNDKGLPVMAKCKLTGKFTKLSLAYNEMQSYYG